MFAAALFCVSCDKSGTEYPGYSYNEPVPETIEFGSATLSYYGDPTLSDVSDLWVIELKDGSGAETGSGYRMNISLNARLKPDGTPDMARLAGTYHMPANSGDMSALTFNTGYMTEQDRPNGAITVAAGSFFTDTDEEPVSDADLLREGYCLIEVDDSGTMTIEGIMIGTEYLKRYFRYSGVPEVTDLSRTGESGFPNSNLTEDIELRSLSATRLVDKGDSYFLGDQSYRHFEFYIADSGIDLSTQWPGGDGELLRLELFVPWESDPADGVPAGVYSVPDDIPESGGVYREDIVPFRIVPGYPDRFTNNTGTWYQYMEDGKWIRYARITGGTVTVERPDGRYRITVDLTDCTEQAHHIKCLWEN